MSLFDFTFGLSAVILGLALTHLASSLHRLALAGRQVRWAPEPILLSGIIFLVIVSVWLFQWPDRNVSQTTIGLMLLQVCKLLLPYLAAAFVLPEQVAPEEEIDLLTHYNRTRTFTFGALIAGLLLFWVFNLARESMYGPGPFSLLKALAAGPWPLVGLYTLLIFIRVRWVNIIVLTGVFLAFGWQVIGIPLHA